MKGILGKKVGMTQIFTEEGIVIPCTVVEAGPCVVLQKKEVENDGYEAIQLGYKEKKVHRATQPEIGHATKASAKPQHYVKEIRGVNLEEYQLGQEVKADLFAEGEMVDVTGISKGKGFAGAIKRHNQSRGPMSHGSRYHRRPGSLGAINPARVFKGQTMPGRMGGDRVTQQNLKVVRVDSDKNLLLIQGAVPGPRNSYVMIRSATKR